MSKTGQRTLAIPVTERQYRGLRFQARLLEGVFGIACTPEDVAQTRLERSLDRVAERQRRTRR